MAKIENIGPIAKRPRYPRYSVRKLAPPATSARGSRLPCSTVSAPISPRPKFEIDGGIESEGVGACPRGKSLEMRPRPARKGDDLDCGAARLQAGDDRLDRRDAPALEFIGRQDARPAIENLHDFDAGFDLLGQIIDRAGNEPVDQTLKQVRLAIGEEARWGLIGRALPGDHIARDRPRRAAKADQGDRPQAKPPSPARPSRRPAPDGQDRSSRAMR